MSERTCQKYIFARIHGGVWFLPPAWTHTCKNVRVKKMLARIHGGVWLLPPALTHTRHSVRVTNARVRSGLRHSVDHKQGGM